MQGTLTTMFLWSEARWRPSLHHPLGVGRHHLARDRAVDRLADLDQDLLGVALLLREQARVGGDAVHDAERRGLADLRQARGVEKDLHDSCLRVAAPAGPPSGDDSAGARPPVLTAGSPPPAGARRSRCRPGRTPPPCTGRRRPRRAALVEPGRAVRPDLGDARARLARGRRDRPGTRPGPRRARGSRAPRGPARAGSTASSCRGRRAADVAHVDAGLVRRRALDQRIESRPPRGRRSRPSRPGATPASTRLAPRAARRRAARRRPRSRCGGTRGSRCAVGLRAPTRPVDAFATATPRRGARASARRGAADAGAGGAWRARGVPWPGPGGRGPPGIISGRAPAWAERSPSAGPRATRARRRPRRGAARELARRRERRLGHERQGQRARALLSARRCPRRRARIVPGAGSGSVSTTRAPGLGRHLAPAARLLDVLGPSAYRNSTVRRLVGDAVHRGGGASHGASRASPRWASRNSCEAGGVCRSGGSGSPRWPQAGASATSAPCEEGVPGNGGPSWRAVAWRIQGCPWRGGRLV